MATIDKQLLTSMNITEEQLQNFKQLFPEVFTEGMKVDWDKLKLTLGETVDTGKERYGMNWPGKADCFKTIQQPSIATLVPARDESIDFDITENLFIEGDNLEVLKLLQKSYLGKVKMIYIDPPYNTGNEFIYPDNFSENLQTYLEYTGQIDSSGKKFGTNTDTDGRFHSKWLSMMYPRLFLAKNLLREDGVIYISIDDNEQSNLRLLMDEVFGEENFIGLFVVNASPSGIDYGHIAKTHDYALFYAKNLDATATNQLTEEGKEFKYIDEISPFNIYPLYNGNVAFNPKTRPNLHYPFYVNPENRIDEFYEISLTNQEGWVEVYPVVSKKEGISRVWRWGRDKSSKDLNKELVGHKTNEGEFRIVQKTRHTSKVIRSLLLENTFSSRKGTGDFESLIPGKIFSFPKPVELIKSFIECGSGPNDYILDFFAGSGSTAQAVLQLNNEAGGNRKYICVQIPEPTDEKSEAYKAGYKNIAEISKERIRRVSTKIKSEIETENSKKVGEIAFDEQTTNNSQQSNDLGFKVFKLDHSNFKIWDATLEKEPEAIQQRLFEHIDHISPEAAQESILYELLLKSGFELTTSIEKLILADKTVFSIAGGQLLICLEKELSHDCIKAMAELQPTRVICLDEAFTGVNADALKTNAVQIMKSKGVVNFRTV